MSTIADRMAAYHALSPTDQAMIHAYQLIHQSQGDPPSMWEADYGVISHQRQWMAFHAIAIMKLDPTRQNIAQTMSNSTFWTAPEYQFLQDIFGFNAYPDNLIAKQINTFSAPLPAKNARRSYWTGEPRHRRNKP